jgi:hypothetical protein
MSSPRIRFHPPFLLALLFVLKVHAQSFTPGNLAILRIGNGTEVLTNSGNTIFVDQYTPSGGLVNSTAVPDTGTGALLVSGVSSSEGGLTRSLDRSLVVFAGYNTNRGSVTGSLASQSAAAVPRAVASIDGFAAYHLAQSSTTLYSGNNIRSATADGTNHFWTAGNPGGTYFLSPPQAPVDLQLATANTRAVKIINGTLYFSTQAGTQGIYTFTGGGLPQSATSPVVVISTGANSQPAGFAINPALATAYIADQRPNVGGIQKWTNNGTAWGLAYTFITGAGAFDVAADFTGSGPVIYATTAEASGNRLISVVDAGPLSIIKVLAMSGANRVFKGLDFAPDLSPAILQQPQSQTVANGSTATFSVVVQSRYPVSYQWQKDGALLLGATSSALTFPGVSASAQGTYSVTITNLYGSLTSSNAVLTVNQVLTPPSITSQPTSQSVALGGSVTLSVSVTGTPPLSYQWQLNGGELSGQTNSNLTLNNAGPSDQGSYLVRVSNPGGTTNSQPATITVLSPNPSFVPYPSAGFVYSQNFDSLPNPGVTSVNADNPVKIGGATYGLANPFDFSFPILSNSVNQNTGVGLGGLGLSNSMSGWYGLGQVAPKFGASAGDQSTGGVISFGLTNSPSVAANRALGLLATSSTGSTALGLRFLNQTSNTLNQISLRFAGELWRQAAVQKIISVSYWVDPTASAGFGTNITGLLTNVTFTANPAATNPVPVDGTATANQMIIAINNQTIADWAPGAALWLSWQMLDATGKGQGLAIDDLTFSATSSSTVLVPQLSIQAAATNVVVSWLVSGDTFVLQANSDLSLPAGWTTAPQQVVITNGTNTVTIPIGPSQQFYRLKK